MYGQFYLLETVEIVKDGSRRLCQSNTEMIPLPIDDAACLQIRCIFHCIAATITVNSS